MDMNHYGPDCVQVRVFFSHLPVGLNPPLPHSNNYLNIHYKFFDSLGVPIIIVRANLDTIMRETRNSAATGGNYSTVHFWGFYDFSGFLMGAESIS